MNEGGRYMRSIIRKELKLLFKEKGNLFFLLIMPMLFIVLFGSVFSESSNATITVHCVDLDQSKVSKSFLRAVGRVKGFSLRTDGPEMLNERLQEVRDGKLSELVIIQKGFGNAVTSGRPAEIRFHHNIGKETVTGPIESVLNTVATRYQEQRVGAALSTAGKNPDEVKQLLDPPIHIREIKEGGAGGKDNVLNQVVPGYTVMFVFFIIFSMIRSFLAERESGMLARLRSTPMNPLAYLIGMWIPALLAVLIQCTILLTFGYAVYGISLGDLSAVALIVLCLGICGTGIGLSVSLLARSENHGRGITMLITLGGAALGGLWLPEELMPHFAQVISHFTPQFWALQGFQQVMVHGAHIYDIWKTLAVLLAFGAAGLVVALWRFPRFLQSAAN
jgi:ABC-2 type transport system permease protein